MLPGQLSEHFSRTEGACKCGCGFDTVDAELVRILEQVRQLLGGGAVTIDDACRCEKHNAAVGGSPKSQHIKGKAADIKIEGVSPDKVADCLEDLFPESYGIGRYNTFTHFDVRSIKARWDLRR